MMNGRNVEAKSKFKLSRFFIMTGVITVFMATSVLSTSACAFLTSFLGGGKNIISKLTGGNDKAFAVADQKMNAKTTLNQDSKAQTEQMNKDFAKQAQEKAQAEADSMAKAHAASGASGSVEYWGENKAGIGSNWKEAEENAKKNSIGVYAKSEFGAKTNLDGNNNRKIISGSNTGSPKDEPSAAYSGIGTTSKKDASNSSANKNPLSSASSSAADSNSSNDFMKLLIGFVMAMIALLFGFIKQLVDMLKDKSDKKDAKDPINTTPGFKSPGKEPLAGAGSNTKASTADSSKDKEVLGANPTAASDTKKDDKKDDSKVTATSTTVNTKTNIEKQNEIHYENISKELNKIPQILKNIDNELKMIKPTDGVDNKTAKAEDAGKTSSTSTTTPSTTTSAGTTPSTTTSAGTTPSTTTTSTKPATVTTTSAADTNSTTANSSVSAENAALIKMFDELMKELPKILDELVKAIEKLDKK